MKLQGLGEVNVYRNTTLTLTKNSFGNVRTGMYGKQVPIALEMAHGARIALGSR